MGNAGGPPRSLLSSLSLPLKPTVLAIFVAMTVPVLLAIVQINYVSSDRVARDYAGELVERFRGKSIRDIEGELRRLKSLVATAAELGRQEPDIFQEARILPYFFSVLQHSDTVLNVYVGLQDGSFRQARRISDLNLPIYGSLPPPDTRYAYRILQTGFEPPDLDRYVFLNADGNPVGEVALDSGYDPRSRPWYEDAVAARATILTDPELFWAFGLVGFTLAAPYSIDGILQGVVALDITLDSFSAYLARHAISAGSVSFILDDQGRVVAASDGSVAFDSGNDTVELPHVTAVGSRLAALAYASIPRDASDAVFQFRHDGLDYIVGLSDFNEEFGKRWRLFVVTPVNDFTEQFSINSRNMLLLGLAAIVVQLAIIYLLAGLIASPLQKLGFNVERIRNLERSEGPPVISPVREIALLSRTIETLDVAVKAFACFVPVGLVRQLLESEQKLELGGQSRFLTIFFSDVEGFSTMAEKMPSRDLMARMSTLLEVVSEAVHQEFGTIDKFVGDGVMAFWGAPAKLNDHAWHACVAGLRIQRALDGLNEHWRQTFSQPMRVRVGIHSDAVLVGNVGSTERMSYTVIGDGVNIASRLEEINKTYGTLTCISQDTFREAGDRLCVRPIDVVTVKGRRAHITIYELLGAYGTDADLEPSKASVELARATGLAFDALVSGDHPKALERYRDVLALAPDDRVSALHVQRLSAQAGPAAIGVAIERP